MNRFGLCARIRRRRNYQRVRTATHKYANLLSRKFSAEKPNQRWVTDITQLPTREGVLYASVIKDLHDGSVISFATGTDQTVQLVLAANSGGKASPSQRYRLPPAFCRILTNVKIWTVNLREPLPRKSARFTVKGYSIPIIRPILLCKGSQHFFGQFAKPLLKGVCSPNASATVWG